MSENRNWYFFFIMEKMGYTFLNDMIRNSIWNFFNIFFSMTNNTFNFLVLRAINQHTCFRDQLYKAYKLCHIVLISWKNIDMIPCNSTY